MMCPTSNRYNTCLGLSIAGVIIVTLVVIVIGDLWFAISGSRSRMYRSLEEHFWLWTQTHPFSALVAAALLGAAVSHFFWAVPPPAHESEVRILTSVYAFTASHPEVLVVVVFLAALALHITVGASLHLLRLRDFDWKKLGLFVEQDMATRRGVTILATFLLALATNALPGQSWQAAFPVALATLVASCAAATVPIVRDTTYELIQLLTDDDPTPGHVVSKAY